jgi:Zn finger protein HypA/HybF involved in hydrogenase expression
MAAPIHLAEYKCFDCDEVFLIRFGGKAKLCPRCGSDRIQTWGDLVMAPVETEEA